MVPCGARERSSSSASRRVRRLRSERVRPLRRRRPCSRPALTITGSSRSVRSACLRRPPHPRPRRALCLLPGRGHRHRLCKTLAGADDPPTASRSARWRTRAPIGSSRDRHRKFRPYLRRHPRLVPCPLPIHSRPRFAIASFSPATAGASRRPPVSSSDRFDQMGFGQQHCDAACSRLTADYRGTRGRSAARRARSRPLTDQRDVDTPWEIRAFVVALLTLTACAKAPAPTTVRNDRDFCAMPADICEHRLADEQGRVIVPRECRDAGVDAR